MQEMLESIEFARGDANTKWGSVRAAMGHPEPFNLKYVAIGNEDCGKKNYRGMHILSRHTLLFFSFDRKFPAYESLEGQIESN